MPDFEVLDAKIASALNRIIHNSHFKRKNQSGGTKGPEAVLRNRLLYSLSVYEVTIFRNSIQSGTEFCCQ